MPVDRPARPDLPVASGLILAFASTLFVNGQTTKRTTEAVAAIAGAFGIQASLFPRWGELTLQLRDGALSHYETIAALPAGMDMRKVAVVMGLVDDVGSGRIEAAAAQAELETVNRLGPVSILRFVVLCAAGAAALGVIFGTTDLLSLGLIAGSAGAGAWLRRWVATVVHNLFVQPFVAAMLAGAVGAAAVAAQLSSGANLVAVCPCMILVPGPHILNGILDVVRGRLPLGASRLFYAGLIICAICTGLLAGLAFGGSDLPISGPTAPAPLAFDVIAAGVAVAAFGTFFAMPWRMLPIPVAIGMLAHAARWALIVRAGASVEAGAFLACLVVGLLVTPIADHLRMPFAALAFACVVSLMPGIFLFRMASGLLALASASDSPPGLLAGTVSNGATALLIVIGMAIGLIAPKLGIDHFRMRRRVRL